MAATILDAIGWTFEADLKHARLLEPAAGNGVFVLEAARRLIGSFRGHNHPLTEGDLSNRIVAFELHPSEARVARDAVRLMLLQAGLPPRQASVIAEKWVVTGDFLLAPLKAQEFTHVVGNPPYARWSKIPEGLRLAYEQALPRYIAKGDLFLPFLDRAIESLQKGGLLGFLCSDRWKFMAFADDFRRKRLRQVRILKDDRVEASKVYQRSVDIYPSVLVCERLSPHVEAPSVKRRKTPISDAGFTVRVGPALGCTEAYVIDPEIVEIENDLLQRWIHASDVLEGEIRHSSKRVLCLHSDDGRLRDLSQFPLANAHLLTFKSRLEQRSVVRKQGAPWYRPIDRVYAQAWASPKLLIPELARVPRVALDESGAIPSHGIYAIFSSHPGANLLALLERLSDGGLARALEGCSPRVKGGYVRCYKRILESVEL